MAGAAIVTVGAYISNSIIFFIGFFGFVTLGSGAVKPNLIVLGGDQFDENDPKQNAQKSTYFGTCAASSLALDVPLCSCESGRVFVLNRFIPSLSCFCGPVRK